MELTFKANDDIVIGSIVHSPFTISTLTDNDSPPGVPKFLFVVTRPLHGSVEIRPGNVVLYTPSRTFRGEDTFIYSISSAPDGGGVVSQATVIVRNPYYLYRGSYNSAVIGSQQIHTDLGYLTMTVDPLGRFTAKLRFAGTSYSFKAEFDSNGRYDASILRAPPLSGLTLHLQFPLAGSSGIMCDLENGAQHTTFTAPLSPWSASNPPTFRGRYTFVLPAPDTRVTTPQGNGYGTIFISKAGTASIVGRSGDNRPYTSSGKLALRVKKGVGGAMDQVHSIVPLYAMLYNSHGSIFAALRIDKDSLVAVRFDGDGVIIDEGGVVPGAYVIWSKEKNRKDKYFPKGFVLNLAAHGSNYSEPKANTSVLKTAQIGNFNSTFTVSSGILRLPKIERALLGNRPDHGKYILAFDNSKRLAALLNITVRPGVFSGSFFDQKTRTTYKMSGVFVQGENAAYGLWNSATKTGRVLIVPDPAGS